MRGRSLHLGNRVSSVAAVPLIQPNEKVLMKAGFQHTFSSGCASNTYNRKFPVAMRLGVTPVPIPHTMVKPQAADGTMLETAWESRWLPDSYGGVAQLGEHLPCKQGVKSSNLSISTRVHDVCTSRTSSFRSRAGTL